MSIGKMITPDFLPHNNMLINPLGPLWSGSQAAGLQEVVAADLTRGRHRGVGVRAAWEGRSDSRQQARAAALPVTSPQFCPQGWALGKAHVLFIRETGEVPKRRAEM